MLDRIFKRKTHNTEILVPSGNDDLFFIVLADLTTINTPVEMHNSNLQSSKELGVTPLTFRDILNCKDLTSKTDQLTLFDSVINNPGSGNHWKVININFETERATLEFCGPTGVGTYPIKPFEISFDREFFTGASITNNEEDIVYWSSGAEKYLRSDHSRYIRDNKLDN